MPPTLKHRLSGGDVYAYFKQKFNNTENLLHSLKVLHIIRWYFTNVNQKMKEKNIFFQLS